jgi:ligand-binding SRPBCC domain-containing protein
MMVAFGFFEDPHNLRLITPDWLDFRIRSIRGTPLDVGTTIFYRIRWLGIPITWVSRIDEFEHNRRFVDAQIRGPYRFWRHEHTFEERNGQTLMRDTVRYELPLGVLGRMAAAPAGRVASPAERDSGYLTCRNLLG